MISSRNCFQFIKCAAPVAAILASFCCSAVGQTSGCGTQHHLFKTLQARDELNKGVKAFKGAHYDEALSHFRKSLVLDPCVPMAKEYLGVTIATQVVPNLDAPENLENAQEAIALFQQALEEKPHDVNSMKQIAGIDYNVKKFEDAKAWQKKVLLEDPKDPEAAYTIGVIDWQEAYQNVLTALTPAGLQDDGEGNAKAPSEVMTAIKAQNGALVEEALQYLNQAVENRQNYDDAMAYINLVYRRKADLDWGDEVARTDDMAKADEWRTRAIAVRKANYEKGVSGSNSPQP
jgi:tetratricopeptide (TPR) repeat protein